MSDYISSRVAKSKSKGETSVALASKELTGNFGFDLQFLIRGEGLPLAEIRKRIETMGESVIVVGDERMIRVHVHTADPDAVMKYAADKGNLTDVVNQNMDEQVNKFKKMHQQENYSAL